MATQVVIEEEQEGEHVETTDYFFKKIGEPVPVEDQDHSPFDLQSPPLQPLAVAEQFRLLFVAHSSGFFAARTKDVIDLAKEIKKKGSGSSSSGIKELSLVDVPIGKPHVLSVSADNSTLAVSVAADVHFFLVQSLLNKEVTPSFSCCLAGASFVRDIQWRKNGDDSFLVLSDTGKLSHGIVNHPPEHVMDGVDAVDWNVKGSFVAVAKGQNLSILSSKFVEKISFAFQFNSWISEADGSSVVKVDSVKWIRSDCIVLGCYVLNVDGKEENYFVQLLRSKGGKITDATSDKIWLSFSDLFPGLIDDILPCGNGPYLLLSYLEKGELAIAANRKNTDQHILLLSWSLGEDEGEPTVVDIERDNWLPRIELQDNGDDNLIMGLCIDKVSIYGKVNVQLGVEQQKELPPYCVLMCLTLEGKLVMFHVASSMGNKSTRDVSGGSDGEEGFPTVESHNAGVLGQQRVHTTNLCQDFDNQKFSSSIQPISQTSLANVPDNVMDFNKRGTQGPADLEAIGSSHVGESQTEVASAGDFDSQKGFIDSVKPISQTSLSNVPDKVIDFNEIGTQGPAGLEAIGSSHVGKSQTEIAPAKDFDSQKGFTDSIQPISQTTLPNFRHITMKDFNKKGTQGPVGLEAIGSSHLGKSRFGVNPAEFNQHNLQKNVEPNKESASKIGPLNSQSLSTPKASSDLWSSPGFTVMPDAKSSFSSSAMFGKPSLAENNTGMSTEMSLLGKGANVGAQRPPIEIGKIEPVPSIRNSEFSSSIVMEKTIHERVHPSKDDWRPLSQSDSLKSGPHLSKQFSNIKEMVTELDALLASIEQAGGFKDACTILQKSSVEALEKGIASLGEKCMLWKNVLDGRVQDSKQLLDKYRQVSARKTYVEGIVRQASNGEYWKLGHQQKLSPELELKQKHILKLNQDLTKKMFELERHFNSLEFNKFGDGIGMNVGRRASQSRNGPSRHVSSIHSLHNTMASQVAAAEHLSECLSKQMEVLSIESPLKKLSVREELFRTIGISCNSTFSSPDKKKISEVAAGNRHTLSPRTIATKDQSGRLISSASKSHDSDTPRRRRESLDRSLANFEPPKTTVKRMLLQESLKASINKSSSRVDRQPLIDSLERPSVPWVEDQKSRLLPCTSPNKGDVVPGNDFVDQSTLFRWTPNLPESSQSTVLKSRTMITTDRAALTSTSGSNTLAEKHYFPEGSYSNVTAPNIGVSYLQKPDVMSLNQIQIQANMQVRPSDFLDQSHSQISSSPKKSPDILQSIRKVTVLSDSTPGGVKQMPSTTKSMLFQSHFSPAAATSASVSSAIEVPKLDIAISKGQPGEREVPSSSSSVPASAPSSLISSFPLTPSSMSPGAKPLFTMAHPSVSAPSSLAVSSLSSAPFPSPTSFSIVQTSSSPQFSKPANVSSATISTNVVICSSSVSSASTTFVSSSSTSFPLPVSKTQVLSSSISPSAYPGGGVHFSAPLLAAASLSDSKIEGQDVSGIQEDEMEEEAPETNQRIEFSLGNLSGFGIGSTPNSAYPKPNPFGTPFGNAATSPASSSFSFSVTSGELFKPASFSFQSPQTTQQSQPISLGAFSGGLGAATSQAPSQSAFGQPANVGPGQQALGTVLGSFGQSRQFGSGLPGIGVSSASNFGGGFPSTPSTQSAVGFAGAAAGGGFANVGATSGGFAALASGDGGFAGLASGGRGFGGLPSASGGFGGSASPNGGFAAAAAPGVGSFTGVALGGSFGAFGDQQGSGGVAAFGNAAGGASKPPDFLTQMRK